MFSKLALFVVAATACLLATTVRASEADVLQLTDDDFASRVASHDTNLVMFYAPWCGHCKRLKPEYFKAGELLRGNEDGIGLSMVDCTEGGKESCSKYGISGYPTLKIFKNGELSGDYSGPREAAGIVKYMRSQTGPASKDLPTVAAYEAFIAKTDETSVLGFFSDAKSHQALSLQKYADKFREKLRFGHSSAPEVLAAAGYKDQIVVFRAPQLKNKFEDDRVAFDGKYLEDLQTFVQKNYHGLVGLRTKDTLQDFKLPLVTVYYDTDYVKNPKGTNYWRNRVLKVASQYTGDFSFAVSNADDFKHELNEAGQDYVGKPIVVARDTNSLKYVLAKEFGVDALKEFIADVEAGRVEPFIKSEEVPTDNDGPVTVAVAKNFAKVVENNGKDTLIEFYAPWCGHCKKLTPVFEELGEKLRGEDVAIVKMDATANDVPPLFEVRGFPTLFWLSKDQKRMPKKYEGGREVNDFIQYIAAHATKELKGYNRAGEPKEVKTEL